MNPIYLVIKTNGEIWCTPSLSDAMSLAGTALRLNVTPLMPMSKIATITGNSPTYSATSAAPKDHNNKWADKF